MRLTVFNGSPRGKKSNSAFLIKHFLKGFHAEGGNFSEIVYLNRVKETEKNVGLFKNADHVILFFPLYTDAMPAIVKHFIEALEPLCGRKDNPSIGFVIQSGFPEPIHSKFVARYMEKLAKRMECQHTGTVIRGGMEGIKDRPSWMTKKILNSFVKLGHIYSEKGKFDKDIIQKLAPRKRLSAGKIRVYRFLDFIGFTNMYWNMMLKKHKAYDKRFAHPFKDH